MPSYPRAPVTENKARDVVIAKGIITLVFGPKFGAPHWHEYSEIKNDVRYHVDKNLAGRSIVFTPTVNRHAFEIGRAEECWVRLGFNPEYRRNPYISPDMMDDGEGAAKKALFNHWSRKTATFKWIENAWYIYPGGEFWNRATGQLDWGEPKNHVYLNGERLPGGENPAPLFPKGTNAAKVQLGDGGKIIVIQGKLGSHTTGWPSDVWVGEGWPDMLKIAADRVAAAKAERETIQAERRKETPATTGHTLADVLVVILTGPEDVDSRLWWMLCASGALLALWIHKQ